MLMRPGQETPDMAAAVRTQSDVTALRLAQEQNPHLKQVFIVLKKPAAVPLKKLRSIVVSTDIDRWSSLPTVQARPM